jgi:hypothetical protein
MVDDNVHEPTLTRRSAYRSHALSLDST